MYSNPKAKAKNKDLDSGLQTALAGTVLSSLVQATCHKQTFKREFIRKLSNFNLQWKKTLYQNSLNNIAFFFTFFKGYRYNWLCYNTKDYFSWEPEKINVEFHKNCENTGKILKILCVRCHFVKFDIRFFRAPIRNFHSCYYR